MTITAEPRTGLKEAFEQAVGYWDPAYDYILAASPAYFAAYLDYIIAPWKSGALSPKEREFIYITINASITHLHASALRLHIAQALRLGATAAEVMEIFQIISILGVHGVMLSMPILVEEVAASGKPVDVTHLSPRQAAMKTKYILERGFWPPGWDEIVALVPDYFDAHERLGAVPREHAVIEPKVREFILIAVDASTTHLFPAGIRNHTRAALRHGASVTEITEVITLTSILGLHSVSFGMPILMEELAKLNHAA